MRYPQAESKGLYKMPLQVQPFAVTTLNFEVELLTRQFSWSQAILTHERIGLFQVGEFIPSKHGEELGKRHQVAWPTAKPSAHLLTGAHSNAPPA